MHSFVAAWLGVFITNKVSGTIFMAVAIIRHYDPLSHHNALLMTEMTSVVEVMVWICKR